MSTSALGASPLMTIPAPERLEAASPAPDHDRDADDRTVQAAPVRVAPIASAVASGMGRTVDVTA